MDMVDKIIAWESGQMEPDEVIEFFSELIKTGQAWTLQGSYGRYAKCLIDEGYLDQQGNILKHYEE